MCNERRCNSLRGCAYSPGNRGVCYSPESIRDIPFAQCGGEMNWNSDRNVCIYPETYDMNTTEVLCVSTGGTWTNPVEETCIFNDHGWTPLEDTCALPMSDHNCHEIMDEELCMETKWCNYNSITDTCSSKNFEDLSEEDMDEYFTKNTTIPVDGIDVPNLKPGCTKDNISCENNQSIPDAFELSVSDNFNLNVE